MLRHPRQDPATNMEEVTSRVTIHWAPAFSLGPLSINWYGLGWVVSFLVARMLVLRWAPRDGLERRQVDDLALWSLGGAFVGARLYFVAQNEPLSYVLQPWRIFMVWEGGLAFFGGLVGAIGAASFAARRSSISFTRAADLFAPAVPIAAAIGRIPCWLAGMDYGTPTALPWGVVYTHPASYAPNDGVLRHPVQLYELLGDLAIAGVLLTLRTRLPAGALFPMYLVLFTALRFALFFFRGDVPAVALGLTNGHWTSLAIFSAGALWLWRVTRHEHRTARRLA